LILTVLAAFSISFNKTSAEDFALDPGCTSDQGGCTQLYMTENEDDFKKSKDEIIAKLAEEGYEFLFTSPDKVNVSNNDYVTGTYPVNVVGGQGSSWKFNRCAQLNESEEKECVYYVKIYYPADANNPNLVARGTDFPYPVVLISHGGFDNMDTKKDQGRIMASHGYIAIMQNNPHIISNPEQPYPEEYVEAFKGMADFMEALNKGQVPNVDTNKIFANTMRTTNGSVNGSVIFGAMGHSLGAGGVLYAIGGTNENPPLHAKEVRIKAAVALAPPNMQGMGQLINWQEINIPLQIQVGEFDGFAPWYNSADFYNHAYETDLSDYIQYVEIKGANHVGFMDAGTEIETAVLMDIPPTITRAEQARMAARYYLAWFNKFLKQDNSSDNLLFGSCYTEDLQNNKLSRFAFRIPSLECNSPIYIPEDAPRVTPAAGGAVPTSTIPTSGTTKPTPTPTLKPSPTPLPTRAPTPTSIPWYLRWFYQPSPTQIPTPTPSYKTPVPTPTIPWYLRWFKF